MRETPKRPYGPRVNQPIRLEQSALADFFPGVAPLERAAVVRIEAAAGPSLLFADNCRGGLLRGGSRRRREARRLVRIFDLVSPAKPFGEPHDLIFPKYSQINRIFSSCEPQDYTRARAGKHPDAGIVRAFTLQGRES